MVKLLWAILAILLFHNVMLAMELENTKKDVMVLDMRVEGLNKFSATLLECIHDIDRKMAAINPALPAPTMPQALEYSHPIYKIPAEGLNMTIPGGL